MTDESDQGPDQDRPGTPPRLVGILLIGLALLNAAQLKRFKLDWISFALLVIGLALFLLPLSDVGALIESLEFGKTKILFRQARALHKSVDKAVAGAATQEEVEEAARPPSEKGAPRSTQLENLVSKPELESAEDSDIPELSTKATDELESQVLKLLLQNKEAALIQLSVDIERALAKLMHDKGGTIPKTGIIWAKAAAFLTFENVISPDTAKALIQFRNVRNKIIHASNTSIQSDSVVLSAIDSGLKLLRLLSVNTHGYPGIQPDV